MTDIFHHEMMRQERLKLMERARKGGACCPMCDQFAKVYTRKVTSFMASKLIQAHKEFNQEWFHITDLQGASSGGGEFARLRFWGLIEEMPHDPTDRNKRTSGKWRVTDLGVSFINRKHLITTYALMYNGKCLGFEGSQSSIADCLGDKFNYCELMGY